MEHEGIDRISYENMLLSLKEQSVYEVLKVEQPLFVVAYWSSSPRNSYATTTWHLSF
jgi:hypothetical protein